MLKASHMLAWGKQPPLLPERTRRGGSFLRLYTHMHARFKDKLIINFSAVYILQVFLSKEKAKRLGKSEA